MIIQLQPSQIAAFWEMIKSGYIKTSGIPKIEESRVGQRLLTNLLSGYYQTWIGFSIGEDGEKVIKYIGITSFRENNLDGRRSLFVESLYGHRVLETHEGVEDFQALVRFAKSNDCSSVKATTRNKRVQDLMEMVGMEQSEISYELIMEG